MKPTPILTNDHQHPEITGNWMLLVLAGISVFGVIWATGHEDNPVKKPTVVKAVEQEAPVNSDENQNLKTLVQATTAATTESKPEAVKVPMAGAAPLAPMLEPPTIPLPAHPTTLPPRVAQMPAAPPQPLVPSRSLPTMAEARPTSPASVAANTSSAGLNPQLQESLEIAKLLRSRGDTQGALDALRAADLKHPNQPPVLSELALTYEAMLLPVKAEAYWKRLLNMGESVAGASYQLAKAKLEKPLVTSSSNDATSMIHLGPCQVIKDPSVSNGEKITVRLPILAKPGAVIQPDKMEIHVYLFESVNDGERIEQARAEAPVQNWVSAPVDWSEPDGEAIDVTYNLPAPTEEELRDLGKRSFYGYMVKLFYQDKLVGEQADPVSLLDFTKPSSSPGAGAIDGTLFPR